VLILLVFLKMLSTWQQQQQEKKQQQQVLSCWRQNSDISHMNTRPDALMHQKAAAADVLCVSGYHTLQPKGLHSPFALRMLL
jgi:hypothetical protein